METTIDNKRKINLTKKTATITGAGIGIAGGSIFLPKKAQAIDIATVNTDITSIITNTSAAADVAWPIGASLMALIVIGYVFKRFIMQA